MRVLLLLALLATVGWGKKLVAQDDLETLFKKYIHNEIRSKEDKQLLEDVFELFRHHNAVSKSLDESFENRSWVRMGLECLVCRSAFAALFDGVKNGMSTAELSSSLTNLCYSLGIMSYEVCAGVMPLNLPIFVYIIENQPLATPAAFCSLILQDASRADICPMLDQRFDWTVELPPITAAVESPVEDATPLKVVVLTDAHVDPLYEAGGVAECDAPTCCRKGQRPRVSCHYRVERYDRMLQGSVLKRDHDILVDLSVASRIRESKKLKQSVFCPRANAAPAGYWGDYRNCDTPVWAFDNVVDEIAAKHKDVDVVYYIGDTIDHGVWETSYELIEDMNTHVIEKLRATFGTVPIVPVVGNHEAQPTNQFAPSSITTPGLNTTWLYESLAQKWGGYLDADALESLRRQGDFSLLIRPGLRAVSVNNNVAYRDNCKHRLAEKAVRLNQNTSELARPRLRVVSLNNIVAYKYNWWLVYDPEDSKRHLEWLVEELYKAEQAGEKVHILAHIPPGVHDLIHSWTREYNRIVNRFAATIAAEFNGHTHSDEFKIFYNLTDSSPLSVAWGGGSATAYTNYNLNYKIVSVDGGSYEVTNIQNYVYNLTEANLTPHRAPLWFELYDMRHRFGLPDLSAASLDELVNRMVTTDTQMLDLYSAFFSKLSDNRREQCDTECKINDLCKTVVTVLWERQRCEELRALYYARNRLL